MYTKIDYDLCDASSSYEKGENKEEKSNDNNQNTFSSFINK